LLLEGEEIAAASEAKVETAPQPVPKGQRLPDHLPRGEQVIISTARASRSTGLDGRARKAQVAYGDLEVTRFVSDSK
jgi:hypothetical protein